MNQDLNSNYLSSKLKGKHEGNNFLKQQNKAELKYLIRKRACKRGDGNGEEVVKRCDLHRLWIKNKWTKHSSVRWKLDGGIKT